MKDKFGLMLAVALAAGCALGAPEAGLPRRLVLAGDSTLQRRSASDKAGSWGEALAGELAPGFEIVNCARGGCSTKTFAPHWATNVVPRLRTGDWVIVQFGHNDMSKASDPKIDRQTEPNTVYKANLRRFVDDVRAKNAQTLFVTPITLYLHRDDGTLRSNPLLPWVKAMREVAAETGTPVVDLNALTFAAMEKAGAAVSVKWYMKSVDGKDWAHPTKAGAAEIARLFVEEARARRRDLAGFPENVFRPEPEPTVDETARWQRAIDEASARGGGVVEVPPGRHWVPKGLTLKDNVTLRVAKGATLLGSTNGFEYAVGALVNAKGAKNIAIEGEGTLDARGDKWERRVLDANGKIVGWRHPDRPFNVCYFLKCRNVRVEGVFLTNPSSWTCFFNDCDGVVARRVRIWSHVNTSNDGIDIASRNVLVEDCDIDSEDDSLVIKAILASHLVENVEVRNCRLSSNSGICKFGTETLGVTRNVRIHDCELSVRTPIRFRGAHSWFPGQLDKPEETTNVAIDAIELAVVDGGNLENVEIRDVKIGFGVLVPIVVRHGDRKPRQNPGVPFLRNILIENVEMTHPALGHVPCSITGVPGFRPQGVTLRNVKLLMRGGVKAAEVKAAIPERQKGYPGPCIFGRDQFLPAWGFYVRHADGVRFENVSVKLAPGAVDERPAVFLDDADSTVCENCDFVPGRGEKK